MLAAAFAAFGVALAAASLLPGRAPEALVAVAVVAAGACGPLLTGGLSSRLAGIAGGDDRSQRRAEGWDAFSYGVGGTAGPAVVAALAALATPLIAMLALAAAAVVAAAATLSLPRVAATTRSPEDALTVRAALRVMATCGPLRRVTVATMLTAVTMGALSVIAVVFAESLTARSGAGATLVAAFGFGNLAGSLLVTAFPLRGEPETLTARHVTLMGISFGLCALAPSYPLALAAFALTGISNAPFFTATLAARSSYSPPEAQAQVFVSLAGLKVAMASAGTALAGAVAGLGSRTLLAAGGVLTLGAAATAVLDRRLTTPAAPWRGRGLLTRRSTPGDHPVAGRQRQRGAAGPLDVDETV